MFLRRPKPSQNLAPLHSLADGLLGSGQEHPDVPEFHRSRRRPGELLLTDTGNGNITIQNTFSPPSPYNHRDMPALRPTYGTGSLPISGKHAAYSGSPLLAEAA